MEACFSNYSDTHTICKWHVAINNASTDDYIKVENRKYQYYPHPTTTCNSTPHENVSSVFVNVITFLTGSVWGNSSCFLIKCLIIYYTDVVEMYVEHGLFHEIPIYMNNFMFPFVFSFHFIPPLSYVLPFSPTPAFPCVSSHYHNIVMLVFLFSFNYTLLSMLSFCSLRTQYSLLPLAATAVSLYPKRSQPIYASRYQTYLQQRLLFLQLCVPHNAFQLSTLCY